MSSLLPTLGLVGLGLAVASCAPEPRPIRPAVSYGTLEEVRSAAESASNELSANEGSEPVDPRAQPAERPTPAPAAPQSASTVPRPLPELGPFYDELDALVRGTWDRSVRVLWLGDSHTAADFMTDPVRVRLQQVGGNGGPGFLRLGLNQYRHGGARVETNGKWRKQPIQPAGRERTLDGIFGYGGQRSIPTSGASAKVSLRGLPEGELVEWALSVRLERGDALEVRLGGERRVLDERVGTGLVDVRFEADAGVSFSIHHRAGQPQVFGVVVETKKPGVVLDTVGINGARMATALAWEPESYRERLRSRGIDLLVLAFGTNEAFDAGSVERYREHYRRFLEIARAARPSLPCWIVGPPDAATRDGRSLTRVAAVTEAQTSSARELGCAFVSARELMGGEGSFMSWLHHSPPWSRSDRVHLTIAGYEVLGARLADALLPAGAPPAAE